MRLRTLLALLVLSASAALAGCDDECDPDVKVCDERGEGCRCAERCSLPDECPPGQYCADTISACVGLQPGQLVDGCGRSGEKCCELPADSPPNACLEPLVCEDLVCVDEP